EREESRLPIRRNPENRICKEIALQRPKTGKFDYFNAPNRPAHSVGSEFFTDDYVESPRRNCTESNRAACAMLDTFLENCIVYITVGDGDANAQLSDTDRRLKRLNTMRASVSGLLAAPADKTISANERWELVAAVTE